MPSCTVLNLSERPMTKWEVAAGIPVTRVDRSQAHMRRIEIETAQSRVHDMQYAMKTMHCM